MKRFLVPILLWFVLALFPSLSRAEIIYTPQNFQTMTSAKTLKFNSPTNTIGTTDFVTYSCSGTNAKFAQYGGLGGVITIQLPTNGSTVTTTKINELTEFVVSFDSSNKDGKNLKVRVSKDSINWSYPLSTTDSIVYTTGSFHVTLPRNNYYIRIYNTTGTYPSYIPSINYTQDHCNCFIYQPE